MLDCDLHKIYAFLTCPPSAARACECVCEKRLPSEASRRLMNRRALGCACERKVHSCSDSDVVVKIRYNNNSKTRMRERACVCAARRRRHVTPRTSRRARSGPPRQCVTWIAARRLPLERGDVVVDFLTAAVEGRGQPVRQT